MADTRIDELRRRLEKDPGSRLFAQLAEELRKNGELAEAIRVARSGLAVHAAYPSARLTLGRALLDSGDATGARAELESALRDAPDNIQASRYLAQAREQLGDLKGAAEQYRKTLLMAPDDRQLQAALAAVELRLGVPASNAGLAAETTPPVTRRAPPPLPGRAPEAPGTPGRGTQAPVPPLGATQPSPVRAAAPPLVFAPSRPQAAPEPEQMEDFSSEGGPLPATLRIHQSQTGAPAVAPPSPVLSAPAPQAKAPAPQVSAPTEPTLVFEGAEPRTLPGTPAEPPAPEAASEGPSGSTAPFSSSTLAELYYQQGLVDRAVDVYRQLLEQEPQNEKARAAARGAAARRARRRRARRSAPRPRADDRRPRDAARSRSPAMSLPAFAQVLERVAGSVPETEVLMVIGTDGIPIEKLTVRADPNMEAVAAEHTTLLRASLAAAADTGLGALQELAITTERLTTLLVAITPEYFLFASLAPGALMGRARFALRLAALALEREFE